MPMTSRRDPAVLVAGLVTSILWVGTAVLSDWVHANFTYRVHSALVRTFLPHPNGTVPGGSAITGQTILAALLAGLVVMVVAYLATRRLPRRTGTWGVFLGTWLGVVAGGTAGSVADTVADISFPAPLNPAFHLLSASFDGGWWGLVNGWLVGIALVGALALTNRSAEEALPATRRARKPLRARAWPTVLTAGLTAALVWVVLGAGSSWLVWHRSARGPIDLVAEVATGAMIFRFAPQGRPVQGMEVALALVVGLLVAGGTWLATRRLPPSAGRWTLVLAVWFAAVAAATVPAATRSFTTYTAFGLHSATMNMVLPVVQASLFWPLVTGWVAGLVAVLVYARTGGAAPTDVSPEDSPDPGDRPEPDVEEGSRSALHTDAEERSLVP
ncbi:hypothetical protein [Oerskovia rustica]|uniref:DUF998 domain-containing protein n=1 Tax=Oerskovia rustica TaxID=2762237 RepID=A0ABR8RP65_9CELL|nr:hypothetical protein [Oerskovia rustica]MBD7949252.1 hypothetical protein [Oerskovia rustica]